VLSKVKSEATAFDDRTKRAVVRIASELAGRSDARHVPTRAM
jgi:hypothetical protein